MPHFSSEVYIGQVERFVELFQVYHMHNLNFVKLFQAYRMHKWNLVVFSTFKHPP